MFIMCILLINVITSVQNSTFELVNNNKVSLVVFNKDEGPTGNQLVDALRKIGLFKLQIADSSMSDNNIIPVMYDKDALVAVVIPSNFTSFVQHKAEEIATRALSDSDSVQVKSSADS